MFNPNGVSPATLVLLFISIGIPSVEEITNFRSENVVGFHVLIKNLMQEFKFSSVHIQVTMRDND